MAPATPVGRWWETATIVVVAPTTAGTSPAAAPPSATPVVVIGVVLGVEIGGWVPGHLRGTPLLLISLGLGVPARAGPLVLAGGVPLDTLGVLGCPLGVGRRLAELGDGGLEGVHDLGGDFRL